MGQSSLVVVTTVTKQSVEGNDNLLEQVKMETFVRKKMEIVMADPALSCVVVQ